MEVKSLGHSSFFLRGKTGTVVTDPYDSTMVGLKFPKIGATIVTISHNHKDHNQSSIIEESPLVINGPGEYERGSIKVLGLPTYHDSEKGEKRGLNTIYRIDMDSVSIVHLGDLGHKLADTTVESLDTVDILLLPVGGVYTLDAKGALEVVAQLEPKIIIPMHYLRTELKKDTFGQLLPVSAFLKEMGKEGVVAQPKLVVTKDKLPVETTVIVLE